MIGLWLRVGTALTLLWAILIVIVHVIPYDNRDRRAFFAPPEGCAAPCLMGIRPGSTTQDEALGLLRAQPWVGKITSTPNTLSWMWNGKQPAFVSSVKDGVQVGQIYFANQVVAIITLSTATDWGDFYGTFGTPDQDGFLAGELSSGFYPYFLHRADYAAYGFEVESRMLCPFKTRADLWYSPVNLVLPGQPDYGLIPVARGC